MMRLSKNRVMIIIVAVLITGALVPSGRTLAAYPLLSEGCSGNSVTRLQQELKNQGFYYSSITGYFGPVTRESVLQFQRNMGLQVDGIAGDETQTALYRGKTTNNRALMFGMWGSDVARLQDCLKKQGYFYGNSTGYYGKVTENSVINLQKAWGLRIDGIAGSETLGAIYGTASKSVDTVSRGSTSSSSSYKDDMYWLARIIHAEAGGESYIGKVAVGNVIMNRVKSNQFPNSIYGVIFEYYGNIPQFSPVEDGSIYNTPSDASCQAAVAAYNGERPVGNALYFFNPSKAAGSWIVNNRAYITSIGGHAFYS